MFKGSDYPVQRNCDWRKSFLCKDLVRIKLPFSVTSIGEAAFCNCSSLTQITIPNHVESMGDGAFFGCTGLTEIIIPNGVKEIGKNVFCNCSGLTKVTIPERYLVRFKDIFDQDLENWEQSQTNADGSIVLTQRQLEPKEEAGI